MTTDGSAVDLPRDLVEETDDICDRLLHADGEVEDDWCFCGAVGANDLIGPRDDVLAVNEADDQA